MRFILTMAVILSLTGCAGQNFSGWFESEQEKADAVMEEIFEACKNEDTEKISELFSESAREQIGNLDEEVSAFFSYIEGDRSCMRQFMVRCCKNEPTLSAI